MIQTSTDGDETARGSGHSTSPFLRWAGSKRWLVPQLRSILPERFNTYYEPFLGSGAVFFSFGINADSCSLSDSLWPLVNCYAQVRDHPQEIHEVVAAWSCDRDAYYRVRAMDPQDNVTRAAQFIYLNRMCFNGLYRVNQAGRFNVPYGRPRFERVFSRPDELLAASRRLRNADIRHADFATATDSAQHGDLVYLDPPYVAGHRNNGFVDYNAKVFRWEDQARLATLCDELTERGVMVAVSNADHPSIRALYGAPYQIQPISRFSSMSAAARSRGLSQELLIMNAPLVGAMT